MTEVTQLIDDRKVGVFHVRIIMLCALLMFFDGYDIQVMGLAVPSVSEALGLASKDFGWVLSASLFGLGLGAGSGGPLGDRFGRKRVMAWMLTIAGLATLATAFAGNLNEFFIWRFLTGLGIGGMVPNATTLTSEYMPRRKRAWLVTVMYCSVGVGAFSAGITAPTLLKLADWRGLFIFGGIGSLISCALVFALAPESLKFLMARRPGSPRIPPIVARLAPEIDAATLTLAPEIGRKHSILDLLSRQYVARTLTIWTIYVFNIFVIYLLTSWLTTLLRSAGWPPDQALIGSVLFQLGGVPGGLALSTQVDRGRPKWSLIGGYLLCAVSLFGLMITPSSFASWAVLMLLVGAGISGAMNVVVATSASLYPLTIRSTGVGWAVTVGRIGAITAPLLGGVIIQHFSPVGALGLMIIPCLIAAAAALNLRKEWLER